MSKEVQAKESSLAQKQQKAAEIIEKIKGENKLKEAD